MEWAEALNAAAGVLERYVSAYDIYDVIGLTYAFSNVGRCRGGHASSKRRNQPRASD
jgi:hypothetical protein